MNKHVLALSTALSILAFTPAFAQDTTTAPAAPIVDCAQLSNANDAACAANKLQNNSETQDQSGSSTTGTTMNSDSTKTQDHIGKSDQIGATGTQGTDAGTGSTMSSTTTGAGTVQMTGDLIVPAEQLNGAKLMSANDYIGKTVYDENGNSIGDVNDLIVSGDGNVAAVILGVGGFLGIGEKHIAVNTTAVQITQDGNSQRLVVQATKEALDAAPSYDRNNRRYADQTNGAGTGMTDDTTGSTTRAPATGMGTVAPTGATGTVDCTLAENASNAVCANKLQQ